MYSINLKVCRLKLQLNINIKEQPVCGYIVQIVDIKILVTKSKTKQKSSALLQKQQQTKKKHQKKTQQDSSKSIRIFIDFMKASNRIWSAALWYNISANLIQVIKHLYDKATSAVLFNNSIGDWFQTTTGIKEVCPFSPTLFNLFLERIMTDALEDHEGTVSIGGRTITSLRFADDIDG